MKLNQLSPVKGSRKNKKRAGRGPGSGLGKTCGRGTKGQKSRSGSKLRPWFEGGQMPLQRRVPKRGFSNPNRCEYAIVNVGQVAARFKSGQTVDAAALIASGLVKNPRDGIKLLGVGEIKKKLTIKVSKASQTARAKIEAAGGKVEVAG